MADERGRLIYARVVPTRAALPLAVILGLWLLAIPARAEPDIALDWTAPPECPDGEHVKRRLGEALADSTAAHHLDVNAEVIAPEATRPRWDLRLTFAGDATGERRVSAQSCDALADVAVVVIALAYDPLNVRTPTPPPAPPPSPPMPAPVPVAPAPPTFAPPPPAPVFVPPPWRPPLRATSSPRPRFGAHFAGLADVGSLPRVAVGFQGGVRVRWPRWVVGLRGSYLPEVAARLPERPATGGEVSAAAGSLQGCGLPWRSRSDRSLGALGLRVCLAAEIGSMRAVGVGVDEPGEGKGLTAAAEAGAGLDLWLGGPLLLVVDLGLGVPFVRPFFFLNEIGEVHQPGPVRGRLELGFEASF